MMRHLQTPTMLLVLGMFLGPGTFATGQEFQEYVVEPFNPRTLEQPVEKGREALANIPQANWYDRDEDNVRTIPVPGEPKMPESRPGAPPKTKPKKKTTTTNWNWWPSFNGMSLGAILIYSMLFALLALIAYLIFRAIRAGGAVPSSSAIDEQRLDETSRQVDRVEHLPFEVKKKDANLLDEARRCYEAGNFNEAIVYLFSFQLLELDKGHVIRLTKGKTNGQYLRELGRNRNLRQILQQTMNAFEDVFFGNRNLTQDRFERCWNQLTQFDQLLAGGKP